LPRNAGLWPWPWNRKCAPLVEENPAKVVLAEAEVPLANREAFRSGHMGVMDYYNMRNLQSDTQMRTPSPASAANSNSSASDRAVGG